MVLPVVTASSWVIERFWSDPGGSNPLLELVLTSADPLALACFAFTALVVAPCLRRFSSGVSCYRWQACGSVAPEL